MTKTKTKTTDALVEREINALFGTLLGFVSQLMLNPVDLSLSLRQRQASRGLCFKVLNLHALSKAPSMKKS